jgi:pimeloyl-ACP methyl ester carboxylesterase
MTTLTEHTPVRTLKKPEAKSRKKIKLPLSLRLIQWLFPKLEVIAPPLAHRWFARLFFSPPRYPVSLSEKEILQLSKRFSISVEQHSVACYEWGTGPVILFVHGWAGRATQFSHFIKRFTQAGYSVISFDAPAHGLSKGSKTSIIDFKNVILELEKKFVHIDGIVAHSLGGSASLFALSEGLKVKKLITIATPTLPEEIVTEFASRLKASSKAIDYLKMRVPIVFHRPFNHFMADHFVRLLKQPIDWMIIHDENDKEASIHNAERLMEVYPAAHFIKTTGLGHVRILREEKVIADCLNFINDPTNSWPLRTDSQY